MLLGQQARDGEEHDATADQHRRHVGKRPGKRSRIKRRMRRRMRRYWKQPRVMAEQRTMMDMFLENYFE